MAYEFLSPEYQQLTRDWLSRRSAELDQAALLLAQNSLQPAKQGQPLLHLPEVVLPTTGLPDATERESLTPPLAQHGRTTDLDSPVTAIRDSFEPVLPVDSVTSLLTAEADWRLRDVIKHPSVVLVLGKRDGGKTTVSYRILELFRHIAAPYVVGVPEAARKHIPDWIGIVPSLDDLPTKCIALVDEAYLKYHARGSMAAANKAMSQVLNLSRQREQTLIFVTQEARQMDRNIVSSANVVIFKDLGVLQLEFERPELAKLGGAASRAFAELEGSKKPWNFVYAPDSDFIGLVENQKPTFWNPSLSRLFAVGSTPAPARYTVPSTPKMKAEIAKEMKDQDASHQEIARTLGVSKSTVTNYLKGYPYRNKKSS